jgi:hypothetical protein
MSEQKGTSRVYAIRLKQDIVNQIDEYKKRMGYESEAEPLIKIIIAGLEAIREGK